MPKSEPEEEVLAEMEKAVVAYSSVQCEVCRHQGFTCGQGRVAVRTLWGIGWRPSLRLRGVVCPVCAETYRHIREAQKTLG